MRLSPRLSFARYEAERNPHQFSQVHANFGALLKIERVGRVTGAELRLLDLGQRVQNARQPEYVLLVVPIYAPHVTAVAAACGPEVEDELLALALLIEHDPKRVELARYLIESVEVLIVVDLDELVLLDDRLRAKALRRQVHALSIIEAALQSLYESPDSCIDRG